MKNEFQTLIFDRSNPEDIVAIYPKGHAKYPEGKRETRLESLKDNLYSRTDLALVNVWDARGKLKDQVCIYAMPNGKIRWAGMRDHFSSGEQKELRGVVKRLVEVAETYPEMGIYLGRRMPA